jgi:hypothetical protein
MKMADICLKNFFTKKSNVIKNKPSLTERELKEELKELQENSKLIENLSKKHKFELRRMIDKIERGNISLTTRECLLFNRLRISRADQLNPDRRRKITIKHRIKKQQKDKNLSFYPKYFKVPRPDKFFKPVSNDQKLQAISQGIICGNIPVSVCSHFLIGSSLVFKLLSGKLHIADTHKYLMTSNARRFGKIAENCAAEMFSGDFMKHQVRVVPKLPFIVACPDFFFENKQKIIEIKSHHEKQKGIKMSILQTIIAMEAFEVSDGEIWFFKTNTEEQSTRLVSVIKLRKTASIFEETVCEEAILEYVNYLRILLETMNYSSSDEETARTISALIRYSKKKKFFPIIPPPLNQTEFCRRVLQFSQIKIPKILATPSMNDPIWIANIERRKYRHSIIEQLKKQVHEKLQKYNPIYTEELFSQCKLIDRTDKPLNREVVFELCGYDNNVRLNQEKTLIPQYKNNTELFEVFEITVDQKYINQLLKNRVVVAYSYDRKYIKTLDENIKSSL